MEAKAIVNKMMEKDAFSQWLNIEILEINPGFCQLKTSVLPEMVNGFNIAHGGISYSLSDSALAFAANAYGKQCVSIETSISHTRPAKIGDELMVTCTELNRGKTIGIYEVKIKNQADKIISLFKGTVHISDRDWS
ncbi:PaaI family thioesterase [Brumimicrobium aurantiacum]|uniref:Hotdog fold thioesterase n=1 Tax=Brumimicrobium aurantiacum TaxID=1737063 RepID=A0A3E1EXS6_9FLAO|nr:hotdog fold thioesterase [Brumimicrobium aurantiacum]RFC54359.1 hotdog fold thioesterase [Brumimicrobium aurantiacum]